MGRTEFPDLRGLQGEPWLDRPFSIESEMALFSECMTKYAQKVFDTADIVIALGKVWKRRNRR